MKRVHHVASAQQLLLRRHCTRTMCLKQCIIFFVNDIILRSLFENEPVNQVLENYAWNCSIALLSVHC